MELVIGLALIAGAIWFGFFRKKPEVVEAPYKIEAPSSVLDVNQDGKVTIEDVTAAVAKVSDTADVNKDGKVTLADAKVAVKRKADVNKDGKVNKEDAKVVAKKTKEKVAKAVSKTVSKTKARKPKMTVAK